MNAGVSEEVGQTARTAISALGASPWMLGLVALQFGVIGALLYSSLDRQASISSQFTELHQIIGKCLAAQIGKPQP